MTQYAKPITVNIEKHGLESVPSELKKSTWFDYFILQVAFSVNSGNFIVPALAVLNGKLPLLQAVISTFLGAALAFFFVSYLTIPGSRYGLPSQFAIRSIIGGKLSRYIASPIRTITSLYWFAVQTIGGALVFIELIYALFHVKLPFTIVAILFALIMSILALVGFEAVKKAIRTFLPVLLFGQIILFYLFFKELDWSVLQNSRQVTPTWSYSSFFLFSSLAFVQYVSGVSASSDMARFARSEKAVFWGLYSGNLFGFFLTALLGASSAILFKNWNPFTSIVHLSDSKLVIFIILLCAMSSMISININNAYSGGFSLLNTFQSLGRVNAAILFGIIAIIISCFPIIVNEAQDYISLLGMLIIPISATIVCDFLLVKKGKIQEKHLENLINSSNLNLTALIAIITGGICYSLLPLSWSPGFLSFIFTIVIYYLMNKINIENQSTN